MIPNSESQFWEQDLGFENALRARRQVLDERNKESDTKGFPVGNSGFEVKPRGVFESSEGENARDRRLRLRAEERQRRMNEGESADLPRGEWGKPVQPVFAEFPTENQTDFKSNLPPSSFTPFDEQGYPPESHPDPYQFYNEPISNFQYEPPQDFYQPPFKYQNPVEDEYIKREESFRNENLVDQDKKEPEMLLPGFNKPMTADKRAKQLAYRQELDEQRAQDNSVNSSFQSNSQEANSLVLQEVQRNEAEKKRKYAEELQEQINERRKIYVENTPDYEEWPGPSQPRISNKQKEYYQDLQQQIQEKEKIREEENERPRRRNNEERVSEERKVESGNFLIEERTAEYNKKMRYREELERQIEEQKRIKEELQEKEKRDEEAEERKWRNELTEEEYKPLVKKKGDPNQLSEGNPNLGKKGDKQGLFGIENPSVGVVRTPRVNQPDFPISMPEKKEIHQQKEEIPTFEGEINEFPPVVTSEKFERNKKPPSYHGQINENPPMNQFPPPNKLSTPFNDFPQPGMNFPPSNNGIPQSNHPFPPNPSFEPPFQQGFPNEPRHPSVQESPEYLEYIKELDKIREERAKAKEEMLEIREMMLQEREKQVQEMIEMVRMKENLASEARLNEQRPSVQNEIYPPQWPSEPPSELPNYSHFESNYPSIQPSPPYIQEELSSPKLRFNQDRFEQSLEASSKWVDPSNMEWGQLKLEKTEQEQIQEANKKSRKKWGERPQYTPIAENPIEEEPLTLEAVFRNNPSEFEQESHEYYKPLQKRTDSSQSGAVLKTVQHSPKKPPINTSKQQPVKAPPSTKPSISKLEEARFQLKEEKPDDKLEDLEKIINELKKEPSYFSEENAEYSESKPGLQGDNQAFEGRFSRMARHGLQSREKPPSRDEEKEISEPEKRETETALDEIINEEKDPSTVMSSRESQRKKLYSD